MGYLIPTSWSRHLVCLFACFPISRHILDSDCLACLQLFFWKFEGIWISVWDFFTFGTFCFITTWSLSLDIPPQMPNSAFFYSFSCLLQPSKPLAWESYDYSNMRTPDIRNTSSFQLNRVEIWSRTSTLQWLIQQPNKLTLLLHQKELYWLIQEDTYKGLIILCLEHPMFP